MTQLYKNIYRPKSLNYLTRFHSRLHKIKGVITYNYDQVIDINKAWHIKEEEFISSKIYII